MNYFRNHRTDLALSVLGGFVLTAAVLVIRPTAIGHLLLPAVFMPAIIVGVHYRRLLDPVIRIALDSIVLAIVLLFSFRITQALITITVAPPIWDFQVFWVSGKVAAYGLDFYVPQNFHDVANILNFDFSDDFSREILDVGFWYPPMTMFLFVPLGWLGIDGAALLWAVFMGIILICDIFLIWKLFMKHEGLKGLVFVLSLTLLFPPVINNIWFAQTNFIVLLMLLLFWRDRELGRAGIWLAVGIIIKPFMVFLLLYLLIKRRWQICIYTVATLAVTSLLSLVVFGSATFLSFLSNPVAKVPEWFFFELDKGNLYAMIWRIIIIYLGENSAGLIQPIFIGISVVLVLFTFWVIYNLAPLHDELRVIMIVSLALLVYPNASANYYVALTPAIFVLWKYKEILLGGVWFVAIFISLEALLLGYNGGWSILVFFGSILFWAMFSALGFLFIQRQYNEQLQVPIK